MSNFLLRKMQIEKEDSARSTYMKMYGAGTTFQFNKKANVYYDTLAHSPQNYPYIAYIRIRQ